MAIRKGVRRYPRPGERIAPATLQQALLEPVPERLVDGTAAAGLKLCDLDESVWDSLPADSIDSLAEVVVARVAAACARRTLDQRRLPGLPETLTLSDLHLEHRTHSCLVREGLDESLAALSERPIGEILAIRSFGPRCLVDLLCAIEKVLVGGRRLDDRLTEEAKRLLDMPAASAVGRDDPRFGPLLFEIDPAAASARQLAERLIDRGQDPPDPAFVADEVRQLRERISAMPDETIENELIQIFAATPYERNRQIVIGYYGWKDGRSHTLAEIGAQYDMTRERTRQICAKLVKRVNPQTIPAPVTDRALRHLKLRLPGRTDMLEKSLADAGLTKVGLGLENIQRAAKLLGRPVPYELVRVDTRQLAVAPKEAHLPAVVMEVAKKEIYYHGAATVDAVLRALRQKLPGDAVESPLVVETLEAMDGFCWLERRRRWFRLIGICKHGLPRAIDKILAVAPSVTVSELRRALGRNRRMWRVPPPEEAIREFCRQTPGISVEDNTVTADEPGRWQDVLTGVERQMVEILRVHGPMMERSALEELCVAAGMNRFSFHAFVASSPIITQHGHSIYGLLGADVNDRDIQRLAKKRRADRIPNRVLDGHGRTGDGRIWLSYRLSKAASTYAVITVPAALKHDVLGRFRLLDCDGREVGTLAAKDGRAWGLGAFLRRQQAKTDDRVRITLDLDDCTATITLEGDGAEGSK